MSFSGPENARLLGHTKENFIMECTFLVLNYGIQERIPCSEHGNITSTLTPGRINCFTISYIQMDPHIVLYGIIMTLFLDNFPTNIFETYTGKADIESSGVLVNVHNPGTLPNIWEGFRAKPGHLTKVIPNFIIRERLSKPYGHCNANEERNNIEIWNYERKLSYSKVGCFDSCVQEALKDGCGCISPHFLSVGQKSLNNFTGDVDGCYSLKQGIEKFINMSICSYHVGIESIFKCFDVDTCNDLCTNVWQTFQVDAVPWPVKSKHLSFYNQLIKGRHFAPKFDIYEEILFLLDNGNTTEASALLHSVNLIENNYVKIDFQPSAFHVTKFQDIPKTKVVDVFSSLGGTLNLYSGITLLVFVEIIELTWKLFTGTVNYGNQQTQPSSVEPSKERKKVNTNHS